MLVNCIVKDFMSSKIEQPPFWSQEQVNHRMDINKLDRFGCGK